jgi:hypothetical protein
MLPPVARRGSDDPRAGACRQLPVRPKRAAGTPTKAIAASVRRAKAAADTTGLFRWHRGRFLACPMAAR